MALLLLTGCALLRPQLEEPTVSLVDFDLIELGVFQQRYLLTLQQQNPNRYAIPVRGMSYALQVAGGELARGVSPKAFVLPAYGETQLQLELSSNLLSTLQRLQNVLGKEGEAVPYRLSGKIDVDADFFSGTLPFARQGEFKLAF
jgi:LEA14-like dessication related protein